MKESRKRKYYPRRGLLIAVIAVVAVIDQVSKLIAVAALEGQPRVSVLGEFFQLYLVRNPGAAFSFGTESTWVFTTLQIAYIVCAFVFAKWLRSPISAIAVGLISGGALGNLIDRLFRDPSFYFGHVVDFLSVRGFAVFNLADSAITIGVILLVVWLVFSKEPDLFAAQIASEKGKTGAAKGTKECEKSAGADDAVSEVSE